MRLDRYGIIVIGAVFILCASKNGQIKYFSKVKKQSTYKIGNTSRNAGGTPSYNGSTMEDTSWTCGKGAINEAKFVGFVEKYTILLLRTDLPSHGKHGAFIIIWLISLMKDAVAWTTKAQKPGYRATQCRWI